MQMWKQKLGSKATYSHLIQNQVFKTAGYQGYNKIIMLKLKKYYLVTTNSRI